MINRPSRGPINQPEVSGSFRVRWRRCYRVWQSFRRTVQFLRIPYRIEALTPGRPGSMTRGTVANYNGLAIFFVLLSQREREAGLRRHGSFRISPALLSCRTVEFHCRKIKEAIIGLIFALPWALSVFLKRLRLRALRRWKSRSWARSGTSIAPRSILWFRKIVSFRVFFVFFICRKKPHSVMRSGVLRG